MQPLRVRDDTRRPPRVPGTLLLLLNLAILLSNFAVSWGTNETQTRVLRSTARLFHGVPRPPSPGAYFAPVPRTPTTRSSVPRSSAPRSGADDARPPGSAPALTADAHRSGAGTRARLARYLLRLPDLDRLSREQVDVLCRSADSASRALRELGERLEEPHDAGTRMRERLMESDRRIRDDLVRTLRGAEIPEGPMLDRLVRIVVASAG